MPPARIMLPAVVWVMLLVVPTMTKEVPKRRKVPLTGSVPTHLPKGLPALIEDVSPFSKLNKGGKERLAIGPLRFSAAGDTRRRGHISADTRRSGRRDLSRRQTTSPPRRNGRQDTRTPSLLPPEKLVPRKPGVYTKTISPRMGKALGHTRKPAVLPVPGWVTRTPRKTAKTASPRMGKALGKRRKPAVHRLPEWMKITPRKTTKTASPRMGKALGNTRKPAVHPLRGGMTRKPSKTTKTASPRLGKARGDTRKPAVSTPDERMPIKPGPATELASPRRGKGLGDMRRPYGHRTQGRTPSDEKRPPGRHGKRRVAEHDVKGYEKRPPDQILRTGQFIPWFIIRRNPWGFTFAFYNYHPFQKSSSSYWPIIW